MYREERREKVRLRLSPAGLGGDVVGVLRRSGDDDGGEGGSGDVVAMVVRLAVAVTTHVLLAAFHSIP